MSKSAWEYALDQLPDDASLQTKVEAIVNCGRFSGEHPPNKEYYCCEKVDAIMSLILNTVPRYVGEWADALVKEPGYDESAPLIITLRRLAMLRKGNGVA